MPVMLGVEEVVVGEDQAKRNMGSTLQMQLQHQRETRKPLGFMQSCFFCRRMKKKMLYFLSIEILFIKRNT